MSVAFLVNSPEFSWLAFALSISLKGWILPWDHTQTGQYCLDIRLQGNFLVRQFAGCKCTLLARNSSISPCWQWGTDEFFPAFSQNTFKMTSESFESCLVIVLGPFLKISFWLPLNLACRQWTSGQIFAMQMSNHDVPFVIRGCPARQCMVFVLSVLNKVYNFVWFCWNRVYNFVQACSNYKRGITYTIVWSG